MSNFTLAQKWGIPEFDRVFARLLEIVNYEFEGGHYEPWERRADYRPGWDEVLPRDLNARQRYFFELLHWFIDGQRKLGISMDRDDEAPSLIEQSVTDDIESYPF